MGEGSFDCIALIKVVTVCASALKINSAEVELFLCRTKLSFGAGIALQWQSVEKDFCRM